MRRPPQGMGCVFTPQGGGYGMAFAPQGMIAESPPSISYAGSPFDWTAYVSVGNNDPTNGGGPITGYAVTVGALPTGVTLNTTTGRISGTPTDAGTSPATVRATGPGGTSDAVISFTVFLQTTPSGLSGWYDFSDISLLWQDSARTTPVASDADPIGAADDKTVNAFHLLQPTAGQRFTYKTNIQNSRSVGRATNAGVQQLRNTAKNYGSQPLTIFAVYKAANTDGTAQYDGGSAGHRAHSFYGASVSGHQEIHAGATIHGAFTAGAFHVYEATFNGASSELLGDGTSIVTGDAGAQALDDGFCLNGNFLPDICSDADFCEVLIYAANLSASNRTHLRALLKGKWATP